MVILLLALGLVPFFGAHSQDWCGVGIESRSVECYRERPGFVRGQDVTSTAPRFGHDFSGIRTEVFSDDARRLLLAPGHNGEFVR